jgi:hypothetical protein
MTTTELDTLTDYIAKTNSTMFPVAEKLIYYNIGYGIHNGLIIDEQEDNYEEEDTKDTVAGQSEYQEKARIHHINWLKTNYGNGFINARYMSEDDLISQYGDGLQTELDGWAASDPIYNYKGNHFFIYPAPTASQAGTSRLKVSIELIPADLTAGQTPKTPLNFHYLYGEFAAWKYHENNGEQAQAIQRKKNWDEGTALMLTTMFPRARQAEMQAHVPDDDGSQY